VADALVVVPVDEVDLVAVLDVPRTRHAIDVAAVRRFLFSGWASFGLSASEAN
jgi:hypothetical protein